MDGARSKLSGTDADCLTEWLCIRTLAEVNTSASSAVSFN